LFLERSWGESLSFSQVSGRPGAPLFVLIIDEKAGIKVREQSSDMDFGHANVLLAGESGSGFLAAVWTLALAEIMNYKAEVPTFLFPPAS
jgi:hypothetical protein